MKKSLFMALLMVLMLSMDSCTSRLTDFTVISTKNVPIGTNAERIRKANMRVKGVDKKHIVLIIPAGVKSMKEAIDKAIEQYPGAIGLADGVIKSNDWYIPPFYGQFNYIVEGTPLYIEDFEDKYNERFITEDNKMEYQQPISQQRISQQGDSMMFHHEVKKGETLESIAKKYNVRTTDIIKWNQIKSSKLKEGTLIVIYF